MVLHEVVSTELMSNDNEIQACISLKPVLPHIRTRPVSHYHCSLIPCLLLHVELSGLFICHILMYFPSEVSESKHACMLTHFVLARGVS